MTNPQVSLSRVRQSNYELLRLFSIFLIMFYHMFLFVYAVDFPEYPIYKAIQMPIHIGVPLFVMISGYFGIRFSFRGLCSLLARSYFYIIAWAIVIGIWKESSIKEVLKDFVLFSSNDVWFIKTYICLYVVAPAITLYLDKVNSKQKWVFVCILAFMTFYVGDIKRVDDSLLDGKNLLNFIFIYSVGYLLAFYKEKLRKIPSSVLLLAFILISVLSVTAYLKVDSEFLSTRIWNLTYPYNSPLLILSSVLVFLLFGRLNIQSPRINWLAGSVFAVYLIHAKGWRMISYYLQQTEGFMNHSPLCVFPVVFLLCVILMTLCIIVDKLLNPLWQWVADKAKTLDDWVKF